jgi:hypothetical protein
MQYMIMVGKKAGGRVIEETPIPSVNRNRNLTL